MYNCFWKLLFFILNSYHTVKGGEKVLLHFIQDSPGDYLPLEDISNAVGISATAKAGQGPVVRHPNNILYRRSAVKLFAYNWNVSVRCTELTQWSVQQTGLRQEAELN